MNETILSAFLDELSKLATIAVKLDPKVRRDTTHLGKPSFEEWAAEGKPAPKRGATAKLMGIEAAPPTRETAFTRGLMGEKKKSVITPNIRAAAL